MNTILVATDFSITAEHAATYICKLSKQINPKRIILYHALENINPDRIFITDILAPSPETIALEKEKAAEQLNTLSNKLKFLISSNVELKLVTTDDSLLRGINILVKQEDVELVVIGISGKANQNKNVIGGNTLKLMHECATSLMVVPSKVEYKNIDNLMLAWDHKDTNETLPVSSLTKIMEHLFAKLFVVYIDNNNYQTAAEIVKESRDLRRLLANLSPEVHSPKERSVTDGLLQFVADHNIDLMAIVPKKASFLEEFFNKSSSNKIALRTEIPMLFLRKLEN